MNYSSSTLQRIRSCYFQVSRSVRLIRVPWCLAVLLMLAETSGFSPLAAQQSEPGSTTAGVEAATGENSLSPKNVNEKPGRQEEVVVLFLNDRQALTIKCRLHDQSSNATQTAGQHRVLSFSDPWSLPLEQALIQKLDRDEDREVSYDELQLAEQTLFHHDLDDDELIAPLEIAPALLRTQPDLIQNKSAELLEIHIGHSAATASEIRQILKERGLSEVDPWKLPDVVVDVRHGEILSVSELSHDGGQTAVTVTPLRSGWLVAQGDFAIELVQPPTVIAHPMTSASSAPSSGSNGVETPATETRTLVSVRPGRLGLFDRLDRNGDSMLSRPELRATKQFALPVQTGDHSPDGSNISVVEQETSPTVNTATLTFHDAENSASQQIRLIAPLRRTDFANEAADHRWFVAMDVNRDGLVSQSEFLGTIADFERFDINKDAIISEDESVLVLPRSDRTSLQQQTGSLK